MKYAYASLSQPLRLMSMDGYFLAATSALNWLLHLSVSYSIGKDVIKRAYFELSGRRRNYYDLRSTMEPEFRLQGLADAHRILGAQFNKLFGKLINFCNYCCTIP